MHHIKIENCNNIVEGELDIEDGKLNILYAFIGIRKQYSHIYPDGALFCSDICGE